jgi:hypothetical protein
MRTFLPSLLFHRQICAHFLKFIAKRYFKQGAAKEAKLLRENLSDLGCDEAASVSIREEACCILQDMRTGALGANGKNSIAAAVDGAEKSTRDGL